MSDYHFTLTVHEGFAESVDKTKAALGEHGFGIVSEIDMAATFRAELNVATDPYIILGACNPGLAFQAIGQNPSVGVLLPCSVVVRQVGENKVMIDFIDPSALLGLVGNDKVLNLAEEIRTRLEMTRDAIATHHHN
jgi:uncharacterized protein (DUF302 family)